MAQRRDFGGEPADERVKRDAGERARASDEREHAEVPHRRVVEIPRIRQQLTGDHDDERNRVGHLPPERGRGHGRGDDSAEEGHCQRQRDGNDFVR
jgi:hypothetical protein